ncbi:MAG: hypothetical protein LBB93_01675 [Elusimicrobiota bacterium]|jgi:hypothetical protein|nr:hypothetical protein [Elusimicrobiota bacterium]
MFYTKKWIFFLFLLAVSFVLYYLLNSLSYGSISGFVRHYFLDKNLLHNLAPLVDLMKSPISGSIFIFATIACLSFVLSLLLTLMSLYLYYKPLKLVKNSPIPHNLFTKRLWTLFTLLSYAVAASIFFFLTKY